MGHGTVGGCSGALVELEGGKSPQHTGFWETCRLWGVLYESLSFLMQTLIYLCHTDAILSYSFSVFKKCVYVQIYNALGEYVASTAY